MDNEQIIERQSLGRPDYMGLPNESDEELFFLYWCEELIQAGYINRVERAKSYILSDKVIKPYIKTTILKTKTKSELKDEILLREHVYTPEYIIYYQQELYVQNVVVGLEDTNNFKKIITTVRNTQDKNKVNGRLIAFNGESVIEVKPKFDQNDRTRDFKVNQKWMYNKLGIFVNLVIPEDLFRSTFCPKKWLLTPTGKVSKRKIDFQVRTLEEFLKLTENDIQNIKGRNTKIL